MYDDPMWLAKDADCVGFLCGEYFCLVGGVRVLCGGSVRGQGGGVEGVELLATPQFCRDWDAGEAIRAWDGTFTCSRPVI